MIINEIRINGTRRVALDFREKDKSGKLVFVPGRTKQSFRKEVDINTIVAKAAKTGLVDWVNANQAQYGDFTEVKTFHEAQNMIINAEAQFQSLPAEIRKHFDNDAGTFLEVASDPKNHDEMVKLGLAEAKPKVEPKAPVPAPKKDSQGDVPPPSKPAAGAKKAPKGA